MDRKDFKLKLYTDGRLLSAVELKYNKMTQTTTTIALFFGYADREVLAGETLRSIRVDGKKIKIELEFIKANIGYGKCIDHIPRGFKSIALLKGSKKCIEELKEVIKNTVKNKRQSFLMTS